MERVNLQQQSCEKLKSRTVNISYKSPVPILWKLCDEGNCLLLRIICYEKWPLITQSHCIRIYVGEEKA
jgi:hypothetical protein